MKKMLDTVKDFLGVGDEFENDELFTEDESASKEKQNTVKKAKEKEKEKDKSKGLGIFKKGKKQSEDEFEDELILDSVKENEIQQEKKVEKNDEDEGCQTIFVDPKDFSECKKIANYIKNNQMVTLNLEYLDNDKAQRMMDFLMGAMLVQGATFIEISKKVYTSVPKNMRVHYEGKKDFKDRFFTPAKND